MNIIQTIEAIKNIALGLPTIKSFNVGNTWNQANGKGDVYPNVWVEFPVLTNYISVVKPYKEMTFSIDVLDLCKADDTMDEIAVISKCEQIGDVLIQQLQTSSGLNLGLASGLSIKNVNSDMAVGMRFDITLTTQRAKLTKAGEIIEGC